MDSILKQEIAQESQKGNSVSLCLKVFHWFFYFFFFLERSGKE